MPFLLNQTVEIPSTNDEGDYQLKEYEAEVGTVSKAFLGFDADHNSFSFAIEIKGHYNDYTKSTGYRGLDADASSMALVREVIKTLGGGYSNFSSLVGKPAILLRDRDVSYTPVGVASPITGQYCLFATDYSIVKEEVDVPF